MTPEPIALDELPDAAPLFGTAGSGDSIDKVQCPECDKSFLPTGIKRHITMAHRGGVSDTGGTKSPKTVIDMATRWAEFQRGSALLVSFACSQCAAVLVQDADTDGRAIADFCMKRPKLRKQVEQFLMASDMLILVGALGGTAQKMASHHSIGKRIGLTDTSHPGEHGQGMQGVAQFMKNMSEEDRNALLNGAIDHMADITPNEPAVTEEWSPSGV